MHALNPLDPARLDADLARGVDAACRALANAWRTGQDLRIEDCLEDVPAPGRPALLVALIALERALLVKRGASPQPADYLVRFPGRDREVACAFAERGRSFLETPPPRAELPATERPALAPVPDPPRAPATAETRALSPSALGPMTSPPTRARPQSSSALVVFVIARPVDRFRARNRAIRVLRQETDPRLETQTQSEHNRMERELRHREQVEDEGEGDDGIKE